MKNLKRLTKTFAVHAMIISLLQTSFVFMPSYAASNMTSTEKTGQEILNVAKTAVGIYGSFLGQKQQSIMLQIQAQKNQQLMQTLSPSCRKADGTSCYTTGSKFFPECPLPASMTSMPQNVCSAASPDPNQIAQMITYESIAKSWMNYFDQMSNEASNAKVPFGLKCLGDKQKALDSQLTEMVNNLTRLQDQLNKDKETFRNNNKKLLEDLATYNDELMGASGTGKNNLKLKTQDFAKYFSASCQSVIGEDGLRDGPSMGLLGIMQSLSPASKRASDYNNNRALIESEIRNDVAKIQAAIQNGGLQDYFDGKIAETSKYQSLVVATQKQSKEFSIAKERIASELKKIGYTLPEMDKNFSVDFDEFLKDSQTYFKKQYINECVTGADKSGIAISTDQILKALQQRSTGNAGTALSKYKDALKIIMESDSSMEQKLADIKALEGTYQDMSITYQSSDGQKVTETPYDLYMRTLEKCNQHYNSDKSSSDGSVAVSQKKKVERGQALLRELQSLHNNYSSQLASRVLDQALNCNGESKKAGSGCGNKDAFDHTSANFCMSNANLCANEVSGCYAEATKHVETRKAKMEALAKTFNANTEIMVARANQLYNAQKNAVMDMIKVVQARFPGTNFEIPEGMFVSMPELKKDAFGVELANDGNLSFMDELPKKIALLKQVFEKQKDTVNKEIDDYIAKQEGAMSKERGRWEQLAGECKGMIDRSSSELAKSNAEGAKKQAELDQKVGSFCRKYSQLQDNPFGACEDAKDLAEQADKISARLSSNAENVTAQFRTLCNMYNNESSSASSEYELCRKASYREKNEDRCAIAENKELAKLGKKEEDGKKSGKKGGGISLASLCGSDAKPATNKDLVERILGKLPEKERSKFDGDNKEKLVKALESRDFDGLDGYGDLEDEGVLQNIADLGGGADNVCSKLFQLNTGTSANTDKQKTDLAALDNELKAATTEDAKKELTKKIDDKKKEIAAADTKGSNPVAKVLDDLKTAALAGTTVEAQREVAFNRLGEQIDGSCDAQASNTSMPKDWGSQLLQSFDKAILGNTK